MGVSRIEGPRIRQLNDHSERQGRYVLYWMQQSQRAEHNPALEYAIGQANALGKPLLVAFGLMDDYPGATARHYSFMLEGLADVERRLQARGIKFVLQRGPPSEVAIRLGRNAASVVCDRGYLRHQKAWRAAVSEALECTVAQVEADAVIPVDEVSNKAEYAARTIRPKILAKRDEYLVDFSPTPIGRDSSRLKMESLPVAEASDRERLLEALKIDASVPPVSLFRGGTLAAKRTFRRFLRERFGGYARHRNQPQTNDVSHASMYLHFGQISPVWLALEVRRAAGGSQEDRDAFLEELVVRRELAQNFVHHTLLYDDFRGLPRWARHTLTAHEKDRRPYLYSQARLEAAETHDPYWNAAMLEMKHTGYMHNYMRMYWGKKILEWTETPKRAYRIALALNDKYFIDGRDPNSYANVGWVFGLHDRPWGERSIYGTVRSMTEGGLRRKCDPDAYVDKVRALVDRVREGR